MVVQVSFRLERVKRLVQNAVNQLLGSGLPIASCQGNDRSCQVSAVIGGELLERAEGIFHDDSLRLRRPLGIAGNYPLSPFL